MVNPIFPSAALALDKPETETRESASRFAPTKSSYNSTTCDEELKYMCNGSRRDIHVYMYCTLHDSNGVWIFGYIRRLHSYFLICPVIL